MRSYLDGLLRYFEFSGRSTRSQYWLFMLVATALLAVAIFVDYQLYGINVGLHYPGPFATFVCFVHAVPCVTVAVRRLHDSGRSGLLYLVQLIPLVGTLIFLWWMIAPAQEEDNRYGTDPRDEAAISATGSSNGSTIPRQVRMGADAARPTAVLSTDTQDNQRFI